jgi:cell fate (sporulation/competence/biofilm development) regulator YmcA (YheA/YmcA/DUF963 family)
MNFKENTPQIFAAYSKTNAVILSCKTIDQVEVAANYVSNLKQFVGQIKCVNNLQRDFLNTMTETVDKNLKLRRKSLQ